MVDSKDTRALKSGVEHNTEAVRSEDLMAIWRGMHMHLSVCVRGAGV